jgi:hypothetical protein
MFKNLKVNKWQKVGADIVTLRRFSMARGSRSRPLKMFPNGRPFKNPVLFLNGNGPFMNGRISEWQLTNIARNRQ